MQRSDSSVAELAKAVVERKQVPDIIGLYFLFIYNCVKYIMKLHICPPFPNTCTKRISWILTRYFDSKLWGWFSAQGWHQPL